MRIHILSLAAGLTLACLVPAPLLGEQPGAQAAQAGAPTGGRAGQDDRGVQVGVPDGRGRADTRRPGRSSGPSKPTPRSADGHVVFGGGRPSEKGVWQPGPVIPDPLRPSADIPFQPWARALFEDRRTHQLEPHARCKPSGVARVFLTPYGVEMAEFPELRRVLIFDIGGPQTYRTIYTDGRTHPRHPEPTYYGHSIGWWEGDTFVVDTIGFNESFWLDRGGLPHTERLHTLERFTRTDFDNMRYELTVDDPGAYTAPWTGRLNLRWEAGTELFEYVCQEANYAHELMVGEYKSVDRTSPIVP